VFTLRNVEALVESAFRLLDAPVTADCYSSAKQAIALLHTRCNNQLAHALQLYQGDENGVGLDHKQAFSLFSQYASPPHNSRFAQYMLAVCYESGAGCDEDHPKALQLLMSSSEQGYDKAMYRLARAYHDGDGGVKEDKKQAMLFYRRAVHYGKHAWAAYWIGFCYYCVPSSPSLGNAYQWIATTWCSIWDQSAFKEPSPAEEAEAWKVGWMENRE
jgi:TPR repeat protein